MFDSHCHLTDEQFAADLDAVLERAWAAGVTGIVTVASNAADALAARLVADRDPRVHSSAGVHPHVAGGASPADLDQVRRLATSGDVVAIGETGLDFHYDNSPREAQRSLFDWHLALAAETGLPVIVHSRTADDDTAAMIRGAPGVRGVLHCFSGGAALLDTALEAGWFISFAGMVTFRRFNDAGLVRAVPADRLLIETDSPYLAPVPNRGRRNEPAFVAHTCAAVAALRGEATAACEAATTANARRLYGLGDGAP